MNERKLILLTPYPLPGQHPLTLAAEDMACWLNGYSALWHPALLWGAAGPPVVSAPYDYEQPQAGQIFAVPESPPLMMPDDWDQRVQAAGALAFRATPDRAATLANLKAALEALPPDEHGATAKLLALPAADVAPFFGIGLGHLLGATLCEAMEHENLLDAADFWQHVRQAIATLADLPFDAPTPDAATDTSNEPDPEAPLEGEAPPPEPPSFDSPPYDDPSAGSDAEPSYGDTSPTPATEEMQDWRRFLQTAAQRLQSAREVLYPVPIHLLDLMLLDEKKWTECWPAAFAPRLAAQHRGVGGAAGTAGRGAAGALRRVARARAGGAGGSLRRRLPRTRGRAVAAGVATVEPAPRSGGVA